MKILVSRLQFIGDIVLTTPVVESLRVRFPDAKIDYLGEKKAVELLRNNPNINEIIEYDFAKPSVLEQFRVASRLRKAHYDVALDLFGNPRSAAVIYLSGAAKRIGGNFGWRAHLFTHPITIRERLNAVSFHLRYLTPLGIDESYRRPRIFLTDEERKVAVKLHTDTGRSDKTPVIGFHIGATWPAKVWQSKSFARLAELVVSSLGAQVVVTYGPNDLKYLTEYSSAVKVPFVSISPVPLRELAALISNMDLYVSNDAAPMHISAAVGTPTIGIFGPGEPDIWFPYEQSLGHVAFHKNVECCHSDFCREKGADYLRCMSAVGPDEVFDKIKMILKQRGREVE